jgi:hypothetical protein
MVSAFSGQLSDARGQNYICVIYTQSPSASTELFLQKAGPTESHQLILVTSSEKAVDHT